MDRFVWSDGILSSDEQLLVQQNGVRIYDGEQKVRFRILNSSPLTLYQRRGFQARCLLYRWWPKHTNSVNFHTYLTG